MELKIKDIQPLYNMLVTTCDMYDDDSVTDSGIIKERKAKTLKEIQKVLKVGPNVTGIKPGDNVCLKFNLMQRKTFGVIRWYQQEYLHPSISMMVRPIPPCYKHLRLELAQKFQQWKWR